LISLKTGVKKSITKYKHVIVLIVAAVAIASYILPLDNLIAQAKSGASNQNSNPGPSSNTKDNGNTKSSNKGNSGTSNSGTTNGKSGTMHAPGHTNDNKNGNSNNNGNGNGHGNNCENGLGHGKGRHYGCLKHGGSLG
jgi:hypothetical protein